MRTFLNGNLTRIQNAERCDLTSRVTNCAIGYTFEISGIHFYSVGKLASSLRALDR